MRCMGELIKKIGKITVGGREYDIEINRPNKSGEDELIHIQNQYFRYECSKREFCMYASAILRARENFNYYKEMGK